MKKIVYILVIFSTLAFTTKLIINNTSVLIAPESQLLINGTTNVNTFKCEFNIKEISKPIPLYYKILDDKIVFEKARLVLDNECFDCGSVGMNKDFKKLLKSDNYPEIELQLKEIYKKNASSVNALLELHIAGKSKTYFLNLSLINKETICVTGVLKVNITDFDLDPPKKALGLIVVNEDIEINFKLIFKRI